MHFQKTQHSIFDLLSFRHMQCNEVLVCEKDMLNNSMFKIAEVKTITMI